MAAASSDVSIPASAHCLYGPESWTMSHPRPERLELSFPHLANVSVLGWGIVNAVFGVAFTLYALASGWILWPEFSWERVQFFLLISMVFWGAVLGRHPWRRMVIQELVIDKSTGLITATGLVFGRSVVIDVPIAAVTEVQYTPGSIVSDFNAAAEIEISFAAPHRTMRLPELARNEAVLCGWLCAMLGQPAPAWR